MNKLQLLTITCCAALGSCTLGSRHEVWTNNVHKGVELAKVATDDGTEQTWRVYPGNNTQPRIELTGHKVETVPKLGIYTSQVTRERAEKFGATPFRGVWISKVVTGKAAQLAGITPGQILLKVNGQEVHHSEQLNDLIASIGVPGEPLTFTVLSKRKTGDPIDSEQTAEISFAPYGAKTRNETTESVPLDRSKGVQSYTGLQVATVKQELANTIFGALHDVILVTGVVPGSPGYNAGLRAGDRIMKLEGVSNPSLQDIRDAVLDRVHTVAPTAPLFDLATNRKLPVGDDGRSDEIQFLVDGPLGPHDTSVAVEVIGDHTRFYIPIVVGYESSVRQSRVSFLNFIFQFGFNYSSDVHESDTRAPVTTSDLSILPLGMFGVKHGLYRSDYTLFWLIRWSSENYDNQKTDEWGNAIY